MVDATAARTGGHGLHITRSTAAGATSVGGYQRIILTSGNPRWTTAPLANTTSTPLLGTGVDEPRRIWPRVYHQPVVNNSGGNFHLLELALETNASVASIAWSTSGASYRLRIGGADVGLLYAPSVGTATWYRLELAVEIDQIYTSGAADLHVTGWVYAAAGTTPLGYFSQYVALTAATVTIKRIVVGYRSVGGIQGAVAQEGYFDDFAVNDDLVASGQSGIHVQSPWGGATRELLSPNAKAVGTWAEWTSVGDLVTPYENVDDMVDAAPWNDDTDYRLTAAAATTPRDSFSMPNRTVVGAEVAKSMGVICRASDALNNFPYYRMGMLENATRLEVNHNQTGGYFHNCAAVGEIGGGGAWTNAAFNAAELMYSKNTADATAQQKVTMIAVEVEDDDGLGSPPALGAKRSQPAMEM